MKSIKPQPFKDSRVLTTDQRKMFSAIHYRCRKGIAGWYYDLFDGLDCPLGHGGGIPNRDACRRAAKIHKRALIDARGGR